MEIFAIPEIVEHILSFLNDYERDLFYLNIFYRFRHKIYTKTEMSLINSGFFKIKNFENVFFDEEPNYNYLNIYSVKFSTLKNLNVNTYAKKLKILSSNDDNLPNLKYVENLEINAYFEFKNVTKIKKLKSTFQVDISNFPYLTHLEMGVYFTHEVDFSKLKYLKSLTFSSNYSSNINISNLNLTFLKLPEFYDNEIELPKTLECLILGTNYRRYIKLNDGLKYLYLNDNYIKSITLPSSLKTITCHNRNIELNDGITEVWTNGLENMKIPDSLTTLCVCNFLKNVDLNHVKILHLDNCKIENLILNECLEELSIPVNYNDDIILNKNLLILNLGIKFNRKIIFNDKLQELKLSTNFTQKIKLPNLKTLDMGYEFNHKVILPDTLKYLRLSNKYKKKIELPDLYELIIPYKAEIKSLLLPESLCDILIYDEFQGKILIKDISKYEKKVVSKISRYI
jgi:hypothetical protein